MRFFGFFLACCLAMSSVGTIAHAQQPLEVTFSTSRTSGRYYPAHVVAVWVTAGDGTFERSLYIWGSRRRSHLSEWTATHPRTEVLDGITSATLRSGAAQTVTWDMINTAGEIVPDGEYLVHFEYADTNSTSQNYRSAFVFTKGPVDVDLTVAEVPFDVHIVYLPALVVAAPPPADAGTGTTDVDAGGVRKLIPIGRGYGSAHCSVGSPGAGGSGAVGACLALGLAGLLARRRRARS